MSDRSSPAGRSSPSSDSLAARARRWLSDPRVLTLLLAVLGACVVFLIATEIFPYHSNNDDEGVYLQQAAMLLQGTLRMTSETPVAFRPWFFITERNALYSKYSPVSAAIFALGMAVGIPRLALAAVAGANVLLVSLLTAEAFDRRTGALAAAFLVATPFFLVLSSVFLPYPPTTLFDLTFALAYVRAVRRRSFLYGALAGTAIGIAFFSRPYTAVLFALPFLVHASYRLLRAVHARDGRALGREVRRYALIGVFGFAFVLVTLWYNRLVTGSVLTFPYQAFAPRDGLGFGYREILVYHREYTPEIALVANWQVVTEFATRWTVAAPIGTILAAIGLFIHFRRAGTVRRARAAGRALVARAVTALTVSGDRDWGGEPSGRRARGLRNVGGRLGRGARGSGSEIARSFEANAGSIDPELTDAMVRTLLAGLFVSVIVGNVFFWGNLNVLASLYDPTDGFLALYGPFYHFDLVAPLSAFGAFGLLASIAWLRRTLRERARLSASDARLLVLAVVLIAVPVGAVWQVNTLDTPLSRHANYTDQAERAYEPIDSHRFENALVFVPPIYGEWLNHPFQYLRNDPSLRGNVVYALARSPGGDFSVIENYENRTLFRYTFRGVWGTMDDQRVRPRLQRLRVRNGSAHRITTTLGVPRGSVAATVRLDAGLRPNVLSTQYAVRDERLSRLARNNGSLRVGWVLGTERARVVPAPALTRTSENRTVALDRSQPVSLEVTFLRPGGGTLTYHYELEVSARNGSVRVIWPPRVEVCRFAADCGYADTYLPGTGGYGEGVSVNTTIDTRG